MILQAYFLLDECQETKPLTLRVEPYICIYVWMGNIWIFVLRCPYLGLAIQSRRRYYMHCFVLHVSGNNKPWENRAISFSKQFSQVMCMPIYTQDSLTHMAYEKWPSALQKKESFCWKKCPLADSHLLACNTMTVLDILDMNVVKLAPWTFGRKGMSLVFKNPVTINSFIQTHFKPFNRYFDHFCDFCK